MKMVDFGESDKMMKMNGTVYKSNIYNRFTGYISLFIHRVWRSSVNKERNITNKPEVYLSLPPTRHDLAQGQKPEGRLKWG